jgi:preprotein translocase subunit SecA
MRIFARDWVSGLLQSLGMEEGVPIESRMITKQIERAQKQVEGQNFESRKHVLEYDDVMNKQREAVYGLRRQLMEGTDQKLLIADDYLATILSNILDECAPVKANPDSWNFELLSTQVFDLFGMKLEGTEVEGQPVPWSELSRHELGETLFTLLQQRYDVKEKIIGEPNMRYHERVVMLSVLDALWKEHLLNMDHLKEGIGLRGYAQQDPLVAYKKESFEMFEQMMMRFQEDTCRNLFRMQILAPDGTPIDTLEQLAHLQSARPTPPPTQQSLPMNGNAQQEAPSVPPVIPTRAPSTTIDALEKEFQRNKQRDLAAARNAGGASATATAPRRATNEVGRNDLCPCGSGKKYKKCHGANA